jgi:hypothetical protein
LVDRNDFAGAEEESSQYTTLLGATERERVIPYSGFEQPEHAELESVNLGRSLSKSRSARREKRATADEAGVICKRSASNPSDRRPCSVTVH